jgi:hypothetical protein
MKRNNLCKIKLVVLAMLIGLMVVVVTGCKHEPPDVNEFEGQGWYLQNKDSVKGDYSTWGILEFYSDTFVIRNSNGFFNDDYNDGDSKMDYNGTYTYNKNVATMTFTERKQSSSASFTTMIPRYIVTATLNGTTISFKGILDTTQQDTITIEFIVE